MHIYTYEISKKSVKLNRGRLIIKQKTKINKFLINKHIYVCVKIVMNP